jgi:hypothetical protein
VSGGGRGGMSVVGPLLGGGASVVAPSLRGEASTILGRDT